MNTFDDEFIDRWFLKKDIRKGTQRSYTVAMKKYCQLTNMSPAELIDEAELEETNGIKMSRRKIETHVLGFKKDLKDKGIARSTTNLYISAIRSFYDAFDIVFPKLRMEKGDLTLEENYGKLMKKEEILELANAANNREKALIYLMALSGMAQQEARNLTVNKFLQSTSEAINKQIKSVDDLFNYESELSQEILTFHITRQKVNYRYITFVPPEATREIINYLKERSYGRNEKIRIKDNDSPLFVNNYGNEMSSDVVVTNFRRIGEKIGLKKKKGKYSYWRAHSLRKYFISTIVNDLGDKILADFLAGHKIDDVTRAYWYFDPEKLKKRYIKSLNHLSLDNIKVKDIESLEYKKLVEDSKLKDDKIKAMERRMELIEKLIEDKEFQEQYTD
ncbi:MAG: tyrosine-type recombinase/integrase [Methanobacteriaceae archaeon]|nr:tyrosine-type recombinase/integrase [Methanobacteriaceae archaeon]